jgi:YggT family protein
VRRTAPLMGLLADVVSSVETFVNVFVSVYWLVLLLYILTSWIRLPYSPWLNRLQRFLYDVSEPYLRQFRRFMPNLGPLDLSPMVGMLALILIDRVVIGLLELLH